VFVGDGPLRKKVQNMIVSKGLADRVFLLGFQPDIEQILPALDVFLLTSRYEGLPRAVLQSLACRVAVVSTSVDGISEVVSPGKNGYLSARHDVDSLSKHILTLLDKPIRVKTDLTEFSLKKMLTDLDVLYTELLEKKKNF